MVCRVSDQISGIAPAKINLNLAVTGKQGDGYHTLNSIMAFTNFGDHITLTRTDNFKLTITGPFADQLNGHDNLITQAAALWRTYTKQPTPYHVQLEKNLPIASGLGGGSSDAATFLTLLNHNHTYDLTQIAAPLGSEMAVCLHASAAYVTGVGERIKPITIPSWPILLINPLTPCSTATIFEHFTGPFSDEAEVPITDWSDWLKTTARNDLQETASQLYPVINTILDNIPTCMYKGMSGSGATCFALFDSQSDLIAAEKTLKQHYPNYWIHAGVLNPSTQGQ